FGDWVSPGRFGAEKTPNATLLPVFEFLRHIDVVGLDVLDIGAADGLVSFTLEAKGARRVVATDGVVRPAFEVAHALIGSKVEYISDLQDVDLDRRGTELGTFDIVVLAGFLYHVFGPLATIAACRKLVRAGGLLIVETVYRGGEEPTLLLNTAIEPPITEQHSTYSIPTPSAVEGMLRLCCFDPLASASLGKLQRSGGRGRVGYLVRAVSPDDVRNRPPQLVRTHEMLAGTPNINFRALRSQGSGSSVPYLGPPGHTEVNPNTHADWIPFQPRAVVSAA
ncbi:MAG: class I SAM-dependent methyltransferase, partial [Gammaproteobacteria bacterium]